MISSNAGNCTVSQNYWKFNIIDGDKTLIIVCIDSILNTAAIALKAGIIINFTRFITAYFHYDDKENGHCAIICHGFEIVGHQHIPELD